MTDRSETPLLVELRERIRAMGPITLREYMETCLADPQHGYYVKQRAIGAAGDFITAPEISQIFGELTGLWCAAVWHSCGAPGAVHLVELGPGRGTLMADMVRVAGFVPGFTDALSVHLVEMNEILRREQQHRLGGMGVSVSWHATIGEAGLALAGKPGPVLLVANEFLDTFPGAQYEVTERGIAERGVGLDADGKIVGVALSRPVSVTPPRGAKVGDIFEVQDLTALRAVAALAADRAFAGLFIDYGHPQSAAGATLQAVRRHRSEDPLAAPGEADLTMHVDFAAVRRALEGHGLTVDALLTQGEFLGRLGILERASRLMAANPQEAGTIEAGVARLMAPTGMGSRFKVLAASRDLPHPLPGFGS